MFLYNPAYDLKHSAFRVLLFLHEFNQFVEPEKLQILEYFYLFPRQITTIRVEPTYTKAKANFKAYPQYDMIPNPLKVFYEIETISRSAIDQLALHQFLLRDHVTGCLKRSDKDLPKETLERIHKAKERDTDLMDFLLGYLITMDVKGSNGLKARTHLLPHSHDSK